MKKLIFPNNFTFGIAESDLQTVGSLYPQKEEQAQKTMWEVFADKKKIDAPLYSSYKYLHSQKDAQLITDLGVKGYRTSISMSRTIDKNGNVNQKAIKWYRDYLQAIRSKGVEIHLCLYHWEAPEQFAEKGVLDPQFEEYFLRHTDIVLEHFSDFVDYVIPLNEAWCISYLSYYRAVHAPGQANLKSFFKAYFAMIDLQAKVIKKIKSHSANHKIGIVNIHFPSYIREEHREDKEYQHSQYLADQITNFIYSDPFYKGALDEEIVSRFKHIFPENHATIVQNAKVGDQIDYYGVNYYNSDYVKPADNELGYELDDPEEVLRNSLGWPVSIPPYYPAGLSEILSTFYERYKNVGLKKLVVSENGTPLNTTLQNEESPADYFRIFFIHEHLKQVHDAIARGIPVQGYFLWTLLDNYEWQEGYKPESAFGIVAVEKKTGKRVPKKSYYWYQNLIKDLKS